MQVDERRCDVEGDRGRWGEKGAAVVLLYPSTQCDWANVRDITRVRGSSGEFTIHSRKRRVPARVGGTEEIAQLNLP